MEHHIMPWITYEPPQDKTPQTASGDLIHAQNEVRRLMDMLKLIAAQDQAAGGNISEAEAWRSAQRLARDALRGAYVEGDTTHMDLYVAQEELRERDSMLCGVFRLLEEGFESHGITFYLQAVLEKVDWAEAGVSMSRAQAWWTDHKAQGEARRKAEAEALARKREAALSKLTDEEREILGV
jgi:hypothetical protein